MRQLFLAILIFGGVQYATAQSPSNETSSSEAYTLDVNNLPLKEALERFSATTKIAVAFKIDLVNGKTSNCVIRESRALKLLECMLEGTGLTFERLETGTYKLTSLPSISQPSKAKHTISGFIRDEASGEALISAAVYDRVRGVGTTSNVYGFYSLTLPEGPVELTISYLGYQKALFNFDLSEDVELHVNLKAASFGLDTLVIEADYEDPIEQRTQVSMISIPVEQIQEMPSLLGEPDILRAVQMLPGVQSGNEGTTGLYVRGGSVDQNLFLLDGATVYNPSHLFGFLSVFHARALNDVTLIKGGFPARYGGRLSSVLDISMKEGNMKRFVGEASLGLAASSFTLEGPIRKDRSSFIVSARRSFIDVALRPFSFSKDYPSYALIDFNAKLNHRFSSRDRIFASIYGGTDRYEQQNLFDGNEELRNDFDISWGNTIATVRWNHLFTDKLFSNTSLLYSQYHLETTQQDSRFRDTGAGIVQERFRLAYESGVQDFGVKVDFEFIPSPSHYIRFGTQATHHTFSTGALQLNEGPLDQPRQDTLIAPVSEINTTEGSLYLEDDITVGQTFSVNIGVHASGYAVEGTTYTSLQPRLTMRLGLFSRWALKASYVQMSQYIHLLVNSGLGLPTDLWLPATSRVKPQHSDQFTVGLSRSIGEQFELSIEAYNKRMDGLIEYKEGASFLGANTDWQDNVEAGKGRAYGIELFLQKKKGATTGWIGYTLSRTDRTFDKLNGGDTFPYKYDRRHDLSVTILHRLNSRVSFAGSWVYGTGNAVTISKARFLPALFADATDELPIYSPNNSLQRISGRNGFRMPAYHRLDLGVNIKWPAKWGDHLLSIGAYNTYNRRNPYFLFVEEDPWVGTSGFIEDSVFSLKQASLFPLLPSFSYSIEF